jgi:hypothetical protein
MSSDLKAQSIALPKQNKNKDAPWPRFKGVGRRPKRHAKETQNAAGVTRGVRDLRYSR